MSMFTNDCNYKHASWKHHRSDIPRDCEQNCCATNVPFNSRPKLIDLVFVPVAIACVARDTYLRGDRKFIIIWDCSRSKYHYTYVTRHCMSFTCHIFSKVVI